MKSRRRRRRPERPGPAGFLVVVGLWTALTGARNPVIWFKLCPAVLAVTAGLLLAASLV